MPIGKHVEQHIKDEIVLKIRDSVSKKGSARTIKDHKGRDIVI